MNHDEKAQVEEYVKQHPDSLIAQLYKENQELLRMKEEQDQAIREIQESRSEAQRE